MNRYLCIDASDTGLVIKGKVYEEIEITTLEDYDGKFLKIVSEAGTEEEMFLERFQLVEEIGENLDD